MRRFQFALALGGEAVGERPARVGRSALAVPHQGSELVLGGSLGDARHRVRRHETAGNVSGAVGRGVQLQEEGGVGVTAHVLQEVRLVPFDVELLEDDVAHGHGHGAVGTGRHAQPLVGELSVVGVVGGDHDDLLTVIAGLGHEVRVGGAGQRNVRTPHDEVLGVVPVACLGDVGLVPEDLRAGGGQIRVPVVEGQHGGADELVEASARPVGEHGHGRDDGEAGAAVRAPGADGVDVGGGDDLHRLVPAHAHHAASPAGGFVGSGGRRVPGDLRPGGHGVTVVTGPGGAEGVQQRAAHVRVADARGGVGVPGEGRAARAAAGLVLGHVRARGGVVGDLLLPRDDSVGDVDLPGA